MIKRLKNKLSGWDITISFISNEDFQFLDLIKRVESLMITYNDMHVKICELEIIKMKIEKVNDKYFVKVKFEKIQSPKGNLKNTHDE